jgi:hypothetical protein
MAIAGSSNNISFSEKSELSDKCIISYSLDKSVHLGVIGKSIDDLECLEP